MYFASKGGEKKVLCQELFPKFLQVLYQASHYTAAELTPAACRCSEGFIHLPALLQVGTCHLCQYQIDFCHVLQSCWLPGTSEESYFSHFSISDFPFEQIK